MSAFFFSKSDLWQIAKNGKLFFFLHLLEICIVGKTYRHMHKTVNELASYLILKTPSGDKPEIVNYEIVSLYVNYLPDSLKRGLVQMKIVCPYPHIAKARNITFPLNFYSD